MFYEVSLWSKLTIFYKCGESVYFGSRIKFFILSVQFFVSLEFTDATRGCIKRSSSNFNLDSNPIASYSLHQIQGSHGIKRSIHNELETQNKPPHKWRFLSQKSSKNNTKTEKNKTNSFFNKFHNLMQQTNGEQNKKDDFNCSKCYNCQPRNNEEGPPLNSIYSSTERSNTATKPIYLQVNIYVRNTSTESQRFTEAKPVHFDNLEKFFLIPVQIYENKKRNDYASKLPLSEYYAFVRNNGGNLQNVGPEYQRYSLDTFQGKPTSKSSQIPAESRYLPISTFGMNVEKKNFLTKQNQFVPPYFSIDYFNDRRKNEESKANEWLSELNTNSKNNVLRKQIFAFQPNTENELQKHLLSSFYFGNNLPKYNKQYYVAVDVNKN